MSRQVVMFTIAWYYSPSCYAATAGEIRAMYIASGIMARKRETVPLLNPTIFVEFKDFIQNVSNTLGEIPFGEVPFKLRDVADPPNMVADPVILEISGFHLVSRNFFTPFNCFQHRAVAKSASTHVIDFTKLRMSVKMMEGIHQVIAVDIVSDLFSLVSEYFVLGFGNGTLHQIC